MAQKLLGNNKRGIPFIVSAPAGTGKTTLVHMLVKEFESVVESISYTTRPPRGSEISGKDYHFISNQQFKQMISQGAFLEHVELYGYHYGTSLTAVKALLEQGKHVIMVIDTQGALQLKGKFPAVFIFIKPPTMEILKNRLTLRRTEDSKIIEDRLLWAQREIKLATEYDYCIINDNLDVAYQVLRSILIAEEHKVKNSGAL